MGKFQHKKKHTHESRSPRGISLAHIIYENFCCIITSGAMDARCRRGIQSFKAFLHKYVVSIKLVNCILLHATPRVLRLDINPCKKLIFQTRKI